MDPERRDGPLTPFKVDEAEVRKMRDAVFGKRSSDRNWEECKLNWTRWDSVKWLIEQTKCKERAKT